MSAKRPLAIRQRWRAKRRRVETRPVATSAYLNDSECVWNTCEYSLPRSLGLALSFLVQVKGTLQAAARLGFRPTDCTAIHELTIFIYIYGTCLKPVMPYRYCTHLLYFFPTTWAFFFWRRFVGPFYQRGTSWARTEVLLCCDSKPISSFQDCGKQLKYSRHNWALD